MIAHHKVHIQVDPRGKIKSGARREGSGLPMSLDYFNVSKFTELIEAYGEEPKILVVSPPTNNITDFYDDEYAHYAGGKKNPVKVRTCDGESHCIHRIAEKVNGVEYGMGEISDCICKSLDVEDKEQKKHMCRYVCYFKVLVRIPPDGHLAQITPYLFETGSINSGSHILVELEKTQKMLEKVNGGRIAGLPFLLTVKMVESTKEANKKFPIWNLWTKGDFKQLSEGQFGGGPLPIGLLTEWTKEAEEATAIQVPLVEEAPPEEPEDESQESYFDQCMNALLDVNNNPSTKALIDWQNKWMQYGASQFLEGEKAQIRKIYDQVKDKCKGIK